ncbi:MAG: PGPGW domain-containing protein [Woeseiaceae bacterium]|nr:PGPGW domain-containing protein [Woeseiaceae bacterium]
MIHITYKAARRIVVAVVGLTVLLLGVIMIVTPGPALVMIPLGLAILSIEFTWARYWLRRVREGISNNNSTGRAKRAEAHRERATEPD